MKSYIGIKGLFRYIFILTILVAVLIYEFIYLGCAIDDSKGTNPPFRKSDIIKGIHWEKSK